MRNIHVRNSLVWYPFTLKNVQDEWSCIEFEKKEIWFASVQPMIGFMKERRLNSTPSKKKYKERHNLPTPLQLLTSPFPFEVNNQRGCNFTMVQSAPPPAPLHCHSYSKISFNIPIWYQWKWYMMDCVCLNKSFYSKVYSTTPMSIVTSREYT